MKIVTIVGARPQFVKAAAVSREIAKNKDLREVIVHTGQHFDKNMSDVFFDEMLIPSPDHRLHINSVGHGAMTGRMLEGIEGIVLNEKPDFVLVYGDTNSTLAGALAAKKLHVNVVHVEAGLRSFNMRMPEEQNRILTDRISDILCCPTYKAVENLQKEGFDYFPSKIVNTGDVMQDAALYYSDFSEEKSSIIDRLGLNPEEFILSTVHRAENTDNQQRLTSILEALNELSSEYRIVLPLHPRTANIIKRLGLRLDFDPIEPVGYFDMIECLKGAKAVLTDSGGLQKEAFFFSKPCITMRDETEWVELVENGFNIVVGADKDSILNGVVTQLENKMDYSMNLYGNGVASAAIVSQLMSY